MKFFIINITILTFCLLNSLSGQNLPGGGYERHEIQEIEEDSEPLGVISALYKNYPERNDGYNEVGVDAQIFLNEYSTFGAQFYYLFDHSFTFATGENSMAALRMDYGGLNFNLFIINDIGFKLSGGVNFNVGRITHSTFSGVDVKADLTGDWLFMTEPIVNAYFGFTDRLNIKLGVSYRVTTGVEYYTLKNTDLNGLGLSAGFSLVIY